MSAPSRPVFAPMSEELSALVDGQASSAQLDEVLSAWSAHPDLRAQWSTYHVAGEVMRSADAASVITGSSDDDFLGHLRQKLATEPVVLAPAALALPTVAAPRARRWVGPMAMAASFVLLMSGLVTFIQDNGSLTGAASTVAQSNVPPTAGLPPVNTALTLDGAVSSALVSGLSGDTSVGSSLATADTGTTRVSFGANARRGAGTQVVYAVALREDQLDALWPRWREQAATRTLATPGGVIMPVFVVHPPAP